MKIKVVIEDTKYTEIQKECDIENVLAAALPFDGVVINKQSYLNVPQDFKEDDPNVEVNVIFNIDVDRSKLAEDVDPLNEICRSLPFEGVLIQVVEE